ncbi:hypothetical protein CAG54_11045 [Vibrio sp. V27_P1S3P104]|uniref:hypothetical protein n=1 Tax=unclassified Vibrio TaxID=2614977 RepID=UPI001372C78C|nr:MULTISPECIES: hypothetical protein [unclassified Vibrio]NAX35489.1 hypothetical protein [Vibrio sp. V29_P1S30P107]NAX38033.1 hypothetical protein [Vibrio sp. V27_P1S3P104]
MKLIYPKNAPQSLYKKAEKALHLIQANAAAYRSSTRYGYKTLALGRCERLVKVGDILYVFNKHSEYERFINQPM